MGRAVFEYIPQQNWETYPDGPPEVERSGLRAQEVATAVASWDCRQQVNYDASWQRLNFEIQQAFVDQHWLDLEDWAQAVEAERR